MNPPTRRSRNLPHAATARASLLRVAIFTGAVLAALLLAAPSLVRAEFGPEACFAQRAKAWGNLRSCERDADAKGLLGRPSHPEKCKANFDRTMALLDAKASLGNVACRYLDNTVTDFRTGLMWTKLGRQDGVASADLLDVDNRYDWKTCLEVAATLNGTAPSPPTTLTPIPGSGGYADWRIPNVLELDTIKDRSDPACGAPGHMPCIDPIFGPTLAGGYITSTLHTPTYVWLVHFGGANLIELSERNQFFSVRPVRTAF